MTKEQAIEKVEPREVQAPVSQNEALLRMIQEAATNPDIDLDRMERLFEMRERMVAKEAEVAFFQAMKDAQAEMPQVMRDKKNDQTNSLYARYETISLAIQPVITRHGFALTFSEEDSPKENCMRVVCEVMHDGGHSKLYSADIPFDNAGIKGTVNKTKTHAYGSTKNYGRRYLKCDIFDIAVKDQDNDGNQPLETITEEQVQELQSLLDEKGSSAADFCAYAGINSLPDLPSKMFTRALNDIKQVQTNV